MVVFCVCNYKMCPFLFCGVDLCLKMGMSCALESSNWYVSCILSRFPNFGNSCFLNSSLQALCAILPFKSDLQFLSRYVDSRHHSSLIM